MRTVLITGANRGIGLALTEVYLKNGDHVIATARDLTHAKELNLLHDKYKHDSLMLETVDVSTDSSVREFWGRLGKIDHIDILINNAGVLTEYGTSLKELSIDNITKTFSVNTLGALRMVKFGISKLVKGSKIINVSSKVGSIAENTNGFAYAYRISKAALNMVTKNLSLELNGMISVAMHPGWVKTDMGGSAAPTHTHESAAGLFAVIESLKSKDNGRFLDFRGAEIPW